MSVYSTERKKQLKTDINLYYLVVLLLVVLRVSA